MSLLTLFGTGGRDLKCKKTPLALVGAFGSRVYYLKSDRWLKNIEDQIPAPKSTNDSTSAFETGPSNMPSAPVLQQEFNFDDVLFDDFFPMNWMVEITDIPNASFT